MNNKIIDDLIACGVPSDTLLAVVKLIAAAEVAEKTRAQTRVRVQRFRDKKRDVTLRNVTETLPPPAYTTPPRVSEPKKVLRHAKTTLPTDFELSESDKQHAVDRGWTSEKIANELARFRDHATANNRKQADWHASWRNWVSSPYQKPANGGQNGKTQVHVANPHGKNCGDVGRELFEHFSREERDAAARMLPQIGSK